LEGSAGDILVRSEFAGDDGQGALGVEALGLLPEVLPGWWAAIVGGSAVVGGLGGAALFASTGGSRALRAASFGSTLAFGLGRRLRPLVATLAGRPGGRPRRRRGAGSGFGVAAGGDRIEEELEGEAAELLDRHDVDQPADGLVGGGHGVAPVILSGDVSEFPVW
jgi:hypothetical protein